MKKKYNLLIAAALLVSTATYAQEKMTLTKAKMFGGREQYRTFSVGINVGALAPVVATGGSNDFTNWDANFGYGLSIRKQLTHSFGLQSNLLFGDLGGNNSDAPGGVSNNFKSFKTKIGYGVDLRGVVNLGAVDFMHRENALNFSFNLGYGLLGYAPSYVNAANVTSDWSGKAGDGSKKYVKEAYIPVGFGAKFKVTDCINFDLGYTMNYLDNDNLDANRSKKGNDKFSYTSVGLEFALGAKNKQDLTWINPVATMYDELNDPSLREDVKKLKVRTTKVEQDVQDLKKDTDGDGVADHLDKCANTPKDVKVDGAGCPLNILKPKE